MPQHNTQKISSGTDGMRPKRITKPAAHDHNRSSVGSIYAMESAPGRPTAKDPTERVPSDV